MAIKRYSTVTNIVDIITVDASKTVIPAGSTLTVYKVNRKGYVYCSHENHRFNVIVTTKDNLKEVPQSNPVKVNDIFYSSWGYDQTNIDFYMVVEVTKSSVKVVTIGEDRTYTGPMQGNCVPNLSAKGNKVITKRLHCYLPARSMGLPVEFVPSKRSDVRFEGLLDLNEADFNKIRTGIEHKLEVVISNILAGKSHEEVMTIWRDLVAPDVAFADEYCKNLEPLGESAIDLKDVYKKFDSHVVRLGKNKRGPKAVEVAFACDQNLQNELIVVIASMLKNTKREINAHVLTRGLGKDYFKKVAALFPQVNFYFHDFSDIQYGSKVNLMQHITVSTFDRLFLPAVLKTLDKVLYLDVDILVRGDVGKLFDLKLGNKVFGGKKSRLDGWSSLIDVITRVSLSLPAKQAWALRRRAHETGDLTADTYNAGILLMNLAKMREEDFIENNLYLVEELRLNDQDVMNFWSRGRALAIDDDWNFVPTQDYSTDPKIVHWAGPGKPWKAGYALYKDEFLGYAKELGIKVGK